METSKLYIVPTPIGNLADMTFRSISILNAVDAILCEDTRTSGKLLAHYKIKKPLVAYHQHNEHKVTNRIIERLNTGEKLALITDAGTPGISDPAFLLVRACIAKQIEVETLPGATAFIPALINAGIACERFCFEGFLPPKKGRQTRLKQLAEETKTIIIYESPNRLLKTLTQLKEFLGDKRQVSISRELTKIHEETIRGTFEELLLYYENNTLKGELVIIVEGAGKKKSKPKQ